MFIEIVEKELFDPENIKNVRQNLTKDERNVLAEIKKWKNNTVRVQDKGSQFVVLNNDDYVRKVEDQINRSSFLALDHNPSQEFDFKVEKWLEKWTENKSIDDKWKSYLKLTNDSTPGKIYDLITTHKVGNPARMITSGCSTAMEKLSIFVETVLFDLVNELPSRIRDTGHMLNIVDEFNRSNLPSESIIVGFDIVSMFPSIDNEFGYKAVYEILESRVISFHRLNLLLKLLSCI